MFQACLIAITFLPPPPLTAHKRVMSSVGSVKVSVCVIWKRIRRGETWWVDLCVKWDDEKKEEPSSFINPSTRSRTVLISSVFHLTVHIPVCVCNAACVGGRVTEIHLENKSTFGMFHSILKHAEHRTLNTYTEQLVLSKCSFSFFCLVFFYLFFFYLFFPYRVILGYTEHDGNQSHQVGHIALNHQILYICHACHIDDIMFIQK